jgi:hypothetical protein
MGTTQAKGQGQDFYFLSNFFLYFFAHSLLICYLVFCCLVLCLVFCSLLFSSLLFSSLLFSSLLFSSLLFSSLLFSSLLFSSLLFSSLLFSSLLFSSLLFSSLLFSRLLSLSLSLCLSLSPSLMGCEKGSRERMNKCLGSVVRSRKSLFAYNYTCFFVGCSVASLSWSSGDPCGCVSGGACLFLSCDCENKTGVPVAEARSINKTFLWWFPFRLNMKFLLTVALASVAVAQGLKVKFSHFRF